MVLMLRVKGKYYLSKGLGTEGGARPLAWWPLIQSVW
jgi:hypothetical protein